jgi:hypothetical protein
VVSPLPFRVIPCTEWGAAQPKGALSRVGKPVRTIFHHTAGHVPNLSAGETYEEARAYARAIQRSHFRNGWLDSGHNFLVTRGGYILEGRHRSLAEIRAGKMVASAHCLGQNDQPGIEHEQVDPQALTPIQREASIWLHAWICEKCSILPSNAAQPHRRYNATSCPGSLTRMLPAFRKDVAAALAPDEPNKPWWLRYIGPMTKKDKRRAFALLREAQRRYAR